MWSRHSVAVALMGGLAVAMAVGAESVADRLQRGIYQEETVGDLDAAMKIYQEIVADERANRPHAAQAKFRLGMCHVKKGENERAVATFEELIKEFPGQAKLLEQARGQLTALGHVPESEEPAGVELQEVWSFSGLDDLYVLAISRDSRYCAFIDSDSSVLMVRDLTTGGDRRLTEPTAGRRIIRASISPDNKWVAYVEYAGGEWSELRIVGIDGGRGRVLYANEEADHIILRGWDPESQYLLATLHDIPRDLPRNSPTTVRIVVVSVCDGSLRVLKEFTASNPTPRFSPDGRYVAYHRKTDDDSNDGADIFLVPLDGGEEIRVIEHPANDLVLGWIPDRQNLLFLSSRGGEGYHAWIARVVDGRPEGVPRRVAPGVVSTFWCASQGPVRTPTGGWAFYYRESAGLKLLSSVYLGTLDPDTGKLLTAPKMIPQPTAERKMAFSPDFSRDGKYLAYYAAPASEWTTSKGWRNDPGKIVIRSLETGQERELTLSPKFSHKYGAPRLRWAPDGRSFLIQGRIETGQGGIFRADVETGKLTAVVTAGPQPTEPGWQEYRYNYRGAHDYATFPEWSADGKTVFFIRGHLDENVPRNRQYSQVRLMALDVETGEERLVYRDPEGVVRDFDPAVSPDGQRVVIGDKESLAILPTAGGEPRELVKFEGDRSSWWSTGWTPDSRYVLFVKLGGEKSELWRVAAEGGEPELLGNVSGSLPINVSQVRMHPDGRQVAFHATRYIPQGRIRMMQIVVSGEVAKEMCAASLIKIGKAVEQYKNDHGDVPDGFADLYPDYLQDRNLLLCPADHTGGEPLEGANDPNMRCSYAYRFGPGTEGVSGLDVALPVDFPAREGMTWKEARKLQLEYYGPVVPVAMCRRHGVLLFLGYDGEVYESQEYSWEKSPQAKAGLLSQLRSAMQSEPATWAQRYDTQRFACVLEDEAALTKLLKTHLKEHPEDEAAREFLAEVPRLRFPYDAYDDAEEHGEGQMYLGSSDLELIHDKARGDQAVGIRFEDIPVPQAARIKRAYLQLTAYPEDPGSEKTDLVLHAELAANAEPFADVKHNITSRRKTAASVKWSPEPWSVGGERSGKQRTPDLSSLIQEVVDQPDWKKGNALVLIISGSGRRSAESWDGGWSGEPMLYVEH